MPHFNPRLNLLTPGMVTLTQSTQPAGLAISPDGATVYIANNDSGKPGFETVTVAGTTLYRGRVYLNYFPAGRYRCEPDVPGSVCHSRGQHQRQGRCDQYERAIGVDYDSACRRIPGKYGNQPSLQYGLC